MWSTNMSVSRWSNRNWSKSKWKSNDKSKWRREIFKGNNFGSSSRMSHRHKVSLSRCKRLEGSNGCHALEHNQRYMFVSDNMYSSLFTYVQ